MGKIPLRHRISGLLSEVPFLFFAVVLGVGLTFRVAIGWAKSAPEQASPPAVTMHEPPAPAGTTATAAPTAAATQEEPPLPTAPVPKRKPHRGRR